MKLGKGSCEKTLNAIEVARQAEVDDELNPEFLFQDIETELLLKLASGELNADFLIRRALSHRGLDKAGKWIGFSASMVVWDIVKD